MSFGNKDTATMLISVLAVDFVIGWKNFWISNVT